MILEPSLRITFKSITYKKWDRFIGTGVIRWITNLAHYRLVIHRYYALLFNGSDTF